MAKPTQAKNLTQDLIRESRPEKGIKKIYDKKCPGLLVSVMPKGTATFFVRFWNRPLRKQEEKWLGRYHPETFSIDMARTEARALQARAGKGEDVMKTERKYRKQALRGALTVSKLIDEYVDWIKEEVTHKSGLVGPRVKGWRCNKGFLERFLRPTLGHMAAEEVTKDDIQTLLDDVRHGRIGGFKGTVANALAARDKFSAMFTYACFTVNPCKGLREIGAKGEKTRRLNQAEIFAFWHGLDRKDLPFPRGIALALKFQLVTMLRSIEFRTAAVSEIKGLGTPFAHIRIPLDRVKKRRVIIQPLSTLAQEIVREAMALPGDQSIVFKTVTGIKLSQNSMRQALAGYSRRGRGKLARNMADRRTMKGRKVTEEIRIPGLCEIIGLDKCTPHDLRRSGASLAYALGCRKTAIADCLDHQGKGEDAVSAVTNIYIRDGLTPWSDDLEAKRETLETLAEGIRECIGEKPPKLLLSRGFDLSHLPELPPELERLVA